MLPKQLKERITQSPDGCWEWDGAHHVSGYAMVKREGRTEVVHRVVWEALRGPIPEGLQLDHLCRNRGCCNPDHLELVTQWLNLLRGNSPSAVNARKTRCPRGHAYDMMTRSGGRGCSKCNKAMRRRRYLLNRTSTRPLHKTGKCQEGHAVSGDNVYEAPDGRRSCRKCRTERGRRYRARLKQQGGVPNGQS